LNRLQSILREGDVVAILSNGGFDNVHTRLLKQLRVSAGGQKSPTPETG
jgi:UDP-N-acetylmuramate: L-alanyl-gamma-D-glutamyl-meso-diaminopimelate ligase